MIYKPTNPTSMIEVEQWLSELDPNVLLLNYITCKVDSNGNVASIGKGLFGRGKYYPSKMNLMESYLERLWSKFTAHFQLVPYHETSRKGPHEE